MSAGARAALLALVVTLAIQMFTSLTVSAIAVLAPEIARDFALPPKLVGVFVGMVYVGSMTASLASGGFIERFGAIRVSQICVLFCAAGIAAVASIAGTSLASLALLAVAPVAIGIGYGPITAASSHVLVRTTQPARMALTFSIKQTGVPAGAALAGAALPGLAFALGWRATVAAGAVLGVVIAIVAQTTREKPRCRPPPGPLAARLRPGAFAPAEASYLRTPHTDRVGAHGGSSMPRRRCA